MLHIIGLMDHSLGVFEILLHLLCVPQVLDRHMREHVHIAAGVIAGHSWRQDVKHDDVTKWKHYPRYWPFVRGIHRSPVNSPHKGQWRGALMFSLICACINGWVNAPEAVDLRRHRAHYDVTIMDCMVILSPALPKLQFNIQLLSR